jgi:hypothetical protein
MRNFPHIALLCLLLVWTPRLSQAQTNFELSWKPGGAFILDGGAGILYCPLNSGFHLIQGDPSAKARFYAGIEYALLGSGGWAFMQDDPGSGRVRRRYFSENFHFVSIPLGAMVIKENFYFKGAVTLNRFLFYRKREAGRLATRVTPEWLKRNMVGLSVEGGIHGLVANRDARLGLYASTLIDGFPANRMTIVGINFSIDFRKQP